MRLSEKTMYARFAAGDADFDGRFFTGVVTTGIYCLPSCKARKPRPENVRFFPTAEAARAAGFRACRKCHPDDFARGADPVLETIEALVAEIRREPAAFSDSSAIVQRSGFGATRLFELFRQHYHATPAEILLRARLDHARTALQRSSSGALGEIAASAGFESLSAFHERFREANGLSPGVYRALPETETFEVAFPAAYSLPYFKRALSRDPLSPTERFENDRYTFAWRASDHAAPSVWSLVFIPGGVRVQSFAVDDAPPHRETFFSVHHAVVALLGLGQDAPAFVRLVRKLGLTRLIAGREGLRLSQTPSPFDGLLWAIIGQQINLPFARLLRRRLIELAGVKTSAGLHALPTPAAIAALEARELLPLQFSRQKARYLIDTARLIASGELDLEAIATMSATRAARTLLAVRGLGPWSVNYVMMRAFGFSDCVPYGDTGLTSGLKELFQLDARPDNDATRRLLSPFSPYRSLATAHLWQLNQPIPS